MTGRATIVRGYSPLTKKEYVQLEDSGTVLLSSDRRARVFVSQADDFSDEVCASVFEGQLELSVRFGPARLRIEGAGKVWVKLMATQQAVYRMRDDVFTTLDRPAPVSPEMAAVQRMMRRNELDREQQLAEMRRLRDDAIRVAAGSAVRTVGNDVEYEADSEGSDGLAKDHAGSDPDPSKQESAESSKGDSDEPSRAVGDPD